MQFFPAAAEKIRKERKPSARGLFRLLVAALLVAVLSGCGYHAVQRDPLAGANGVNVVLFVNKSYRPGLEGVLGRHMVDEVAHRTGGRVLGSDTAQLELTGVILSYSRKPVSYNSLDVIREYRSVVTMEATLRQRETQRVLWKGILTEDQVFPTNVDISLQENAEAAAVEHVCRKLAEDTWLKIGERF